MAALTLTITNAGLSAIANAGTLGPVVITQVGVGSGSWSTAPTASATALISEIKKLTVDGSSTPSPGLIHINASDVGTDAYSVKEVGLYSSTGALIAIAGGTATLLTKASGSVALVAIDLSVVNVPVGSLTIGSTGFTYPPATETVKGVAEVATSAEVAAGTDDERIVTPAKLAAAGFVKKSGDVMTGLLTLAGAPTANLHAATKLYADGTFSRSPNGYVRLPSGIIVQWGTFNTDGSTIGGFPQIITYPIPFPTATAFVIGSPDGAVTSGAEYTVLDWTTTGKTTASQFGIYANYIGVCKWIAVGY